MKKCIACNWEGERFQDDNWHKEVICTKCLCKVRHRLIIATLKGYSIHKHLLYTTISYNRSIIHFSPEYSLTKYVSRLAKEFIKADLTRNDCDININMMYMSVFSNEIFDLAIACDVLEHIDNDIAAMKEVYRILKPNGWAIFTVPQLDSPAITDEDNTIKDKKIRLERFGQIDHVRIYGDDFIDRLKSVGFKVTMVDDSSFSKEDVFKYGLKPLSLSTHRLATNHRRIYFANKIAN